MNQVSLYILDEATRNNPPSEQVLNRLGMDEAATKLAIEEGLESIETRVGKGYTGLAAQKLEVVWSDNPIEDHSVPYPFSLPTQNSSSLTHACPAG